MKKIIALLATAGAMAIMAPVASAQDWRDNDRYEHADRYDRDGRYERDGDRYQDRDGDRYGAEDRDYRHGPNFSEQIEARQRQIAHRIMAGLRDGSLSRREARGLRTELDRIALLEERYSHRGLSYREAADLNRRLDWLMRTVRAERSDHNNHFG